MGISEYLFDLARVFARSSTSIGKPFSFSSIDCKISVLNTLRQVAISVTFCLCTVEKSLLKNLLAIKALIYIFSLLKSPINLEPQAMSPSFNSISINNLFKSFGEYSKSASSIPMYFLVDSLIPNLRACPFPLFI